MPAGTTTGAGGATTTSAGTKSKTTTTQAPQAPQAPQDVVGSSSKINWKQYLNSPISFSFEDEVKKAMYSCKNMKNGVEGTILANLMKTCDGVAFLTIARGGIFWTVQVGSGLVLLKDKKNKWTPPAAVGTVGSGIGLQMGVEATDVVLFFKTDDAKDSFKGSNQVGFGISGGLVAGPFGRTGSWNVFNRLGSKKMAVAYAWNWSKGWYAGGSVDVKVLTALDGQNKAQYGENATLESILDGQVQKPAVAKGLYESLDDLFKLTH